MRTIWDGCEGKRVVVFGQRYHLRGTCVEHWIDPIGVAIAQLGEDTTQWFDDTANGPTGEHPIGAIRVPSTAIGLGVQLEEDKAWNLPGKKRRGAPS